MRRYLQDKDNFGKERKEGMLMDTLEMEKKKEKEKERRIEIGKEEGKEKEKTD